jgi:hypothetical protein
MLALVFFKSSKLQTHISGNNQKYAIYNAAASTLPAINNPASFLFEQSRNIYGFIIFDTIQFHFCFILQSK